MERNEWINGCRRVFTRLVKDTLWRDFVLPGGGKVERCIGNCYDMLHKSVGTISPERLADYCICQVYAISRYDVTYRRRWNITHSFGEKAVGRYLEPTCMRQLYEDRWLRGFGLCRNDFSLMAGDHSKHPLAVFIYPEYEEHTKRRLLSTEVGYIICGASTLMWTPFSPTCTKCSNASLCRRRTEKVHHELYRIRCEAWNKQRKQ